MAGGGLDDETTEGLISRMVPRCSPGTTYQKVDG